MGHLDREIYDRHARMSWEEKEEMWDRQERAQRLWEEKQEWLAECRRDEELIRRHSEGEE